MVLKNCGTVLFGPPISNVPNLPAFLINYDLSLGREDAANKVIIPKYVTVVFPSKMIRFPQFTLILVSHMELKCPISKEFLQFNHCGSGGTIIDHKQLVYHSISIYNSCILSLESRKFGKFNNTKEPNQNSLWGLSTSYFS